MTTIVYRDGVMAADSRAYAGSSIRLGQKAKIRRTPDGTLIGCSTSQPGIAEVVMDWFAAGADADEAPALTDGERSFLLLAVRSDGRAMYGRDSFHLSGPMTADYFAVGSGADVAYGALAMGASAERAVEVACEFDAWTAGPIYTLTHN